MLPNLLVQCVLYCTCFTILSIKMAITIRLLSSFANRCYSSMARELGRVVIVGGGVMGCSVSFHLAELGVPSTVIERCSVACGASGKAGGFLAK